MVKAKLLDGTLVGGIDGIPMYYTGPFSSKIIPPNAVHIAALLIAPQSQSLFLTSEESRFEFKYLHHQPN